MQLKKLIALTIAAAVVCIAAIVAYNQQQTKPYKAVTKNAGSALGMGKPLFADLEAKVGSIVRVEVEQKDKRATVARAEGSTDWKLESAGGYPADASKVNELVLSLTGMMVSDRMTDNPGKYANFALTSGTVVGRVRMADAKGATLAELTWGREGKGQSDDSEGPRYRGGNGGRYLLRGGDPWVYLATDELAAAKTDVASWVDPLILSVPRDKIVGVHIDHNSTETLTLAWKDEKLQLEDVLPGMTAKQSDVEGVAQALDGLRLTDVFSANDPKAATLAFDTTCDLQSKDGTLYHVQTARDAQKKCYARFSATYGEPTLTAADNASTTSLAAAQAAAQTASTAVAGFNDKHSPWVYELTEWSGGKFAKKRSDLMQPEPKKEEAKPGDAAAALGADTAKPAAAAKASDSKKKPADAAKASGEKKKPAAKEAGEK